MPGEYSTESLQAHFAALGRRLDMIESQLVLLSKQAGVAYATYAESQDVPPDVVELVRAGKPLDAVKRYREATGASFEQARGIVDGL
ncbi:MAG TPA: hypothetical protein VGF21_17745 [Thermoleophilaceae bacterium]